MAAIDKSLYEKFELEAVDASKSADISAGVVSFNYYEDVYSPMITAMVVVVNTGNVIEGDDGKMQSLYNGFPLRGGERMTIKIAGNSADNKGLELENMFVASIENVMIDAEREMFTLKLVSREAITNETVRVGKRFLPTLTVSFVIASLETSLRVNISLSASIITFSIDPTNKFSNSNPLLSAELPAILIVILSPPLNGNPLYNDCNLPSSPSITLPVFTTTTIAVIIGEYTSS